MLYLFEFKLNTDSTASSKVIAESPQAAAKMIGDLTGRVPYSLDAVSGLDALMLRPINSDHKTSDAG